MELTRICRVDISTFFMNVHRKVEITKQANFRFILALKPKLFPKNGTSHGTEDI